MNVIRLFNGKGTIREASADLNIKKDKYKDDKNKQQRQTTGSIINTTSKRLFFPKGLKNKYCADYLDTSNTCRHGKNCTYLHAVWLTDFHADVIKIMRDHVANTDGYSFVSSDKKGVEHDIKLSSARPYHNHYAYINYIFYTFKSSIFFNFYLESD